jgi:aldehyde dehydrogenase (NAD+)
LRAVPLLARSEAVPSSRPETDPTALIATVEEKPMADAPDVTFESRMLIGGELIEAESGRTFQNVNPATEEVLGEVTDASSADMQRAIEAARRAFDETDWSVNRKFRQHCLEQLQEALEAEREEFREELILEAGCPRAVTYGPQLDGPLASALTYPAKLIDNFPWEVDLGSAVGLTGELDNRRIWREPAGVVGAIVPWNFPLEVSLHKLGQALATGNTVVLKPAPDTPFNASRLGRLVAERTDLPPGVVNVVTSSDHLVGEELTLSPQVDLISFTGSTAVGKRIMAEGAATMKRLFLELGGKSATIVLEDADLSAVSLIGMAPCFHAGQGCAIPTRMLLPRSRYEEGVAMLTEIYEQASVGDPQDPNTVTGPVISPKQRQRVLGYIRNGIEEGATLAAGGLDSPEGMEKGWFVQPTLFTDVDNSMTIAQEEIFGPVLVVIPFEDEDEAIRIANDSSYGLAGNVFSGSLDRSISVARRLRAGAIGVNGGAPFGADVPFGGYKESGFGRQNGLAGFDQYLETKSVAWPAGA